MDSSPLKEDSKEITQETLASKKRRVMEKRVVRVKMGANVGSKLKNEGPPSDSWSWRKYGQKPIKGSPYPRGYYRCSTSKGCSAKKQVERCKTDASVLIITYTSSHNHPGPSNIHNTTSPTKQEQQDQEQEQELEQDHEDQFHYLESSKDCSQNNIVVDKESCFLDSKGESLGMLVDEEPVPSPLHMDFTGPKSEESYDFFDELEELPTFSSFKSFKVMGNLFDFDERIPIVPS